ncbi:hypothetical protein E7V67_016245 [[Empedobacter] haloabium]|uniref:Uncharacterized protein n=1 Tax=[Empedobacter] haloabium TaxID=592317 RepID=A0ABZ1UEU2_9BURK
MEFQNAKYYTPDTLAKQEEDHRPWSVGLTAGWNPQRAEKLFLLLRAEHKRSYEDAEE